MSKRLKYGFGCVLVGVVLLLAAGGFWLHNEWEDNQAGKAANSLLSQVEQKIPDNASAAEPSSASSDSDSPVKIEADTPAHTGDLMGILKIPSLGLTLPVQRDYSLNALRTSPCQFTNDGTLDRLIICGHNYQTHFGKLGSLNIGDSVELTDMDGHPFHFTVSEVMTVEANDWAALKTGDWDLTLFTCTIGGKKRVLVRCILNS